MPTNSKKKKKQTKSGRKKPSNVLAETDDNKPNRLNKLANNPDKINAKRLAKAIPSLEDSFPSFDNPDERKEVLEEVIEDVAFAALKEARLGEEQRKIVTKSGECVDFHGHLYGEIAKIVAPGSTPEVIKLQVKLGHSMKLGYKRDSANWTSPPKSDTLTALTQSNMKAAMRKNRPEIIRRCFENNEAKFAQHYTKLAGLSIEEFNQQITGPIMNQLDNNAGAVGYFHKLFPNVRSAAHDISIGMHESSFVCWQCDKKSEFHCTSCQVARYCSEACQGDHWTSVHKPMCKELKALHGLFEEGMNSVDQAFADPQEHISTYGTKPSKRDYEIASDHLMYSFLNLLTIASEDHELFTAKTPKGPSMLYFYRNIHHVIFDGFWLLPHSEREVIPMQDGSSVFQDDVEFWLISQALMYDYGPGNELKPQLFRKKLKELYRACDDDYLDHYDLILCISPEAWLFEYYGRGEVNASASEHEVDNFRRHRKMAELKVFRQLRNPVFAKNFSDICRKQRKLERRLQVEELD